MKTYKEIVHELLLKELSDVHKISTEEVSDKIGKGYVRYSIELQDEAAKLYAQQVAEDVRQRCSENAIANTDLIQSWMTASEVTAIVDQDSILNTEIILP